MQARLARLDSALSGAHGAVRALTDDGNSPALKDALALSQHLIGRLRAGWYASGLWNSEALQATDAGEVESVEDELFFRLRSIERATLLRAGELPAPEAERLSELCGSLDTGR